MLSTGTWLFVNIKTVSAWSQASEKRKVKKIKFRGNNQVSK